MRHPYLDNPGPIALAHRGGSARNENGLSAFRRVEKLGFRYVETDVRASRDGVAFVFHDQRLLRMTGVDGAVSSLAASEISKLTLPGGDHVPTLRQALERFPRLRFNIDLKEDAALLPVAEVVKDLGAQHRVCVTSFSDRRIERAREILGPAVCTGLGVGGIVTALLRAHCAPSTTFGQGDADVVQIPVRWFGLRVLTRSFVDRMQEGGVAVHVWTLNDRGAIEGALDLGVDGVISDDPALLRAIFVGREIWPSPPARPE